MPPSSNSDLARIILCSGKIYFELLTKRKEMGLDGKVALVRIEELAPFPWRAVTSVLDAYMARETPTEVVWVQEEPRNQGAWSHVGGRLATILRGNERLQGELRYIGRKESPIPAGGMGKIYQENRLDMLERAFAM